MTRLARINPNSFAGLTLLRRDRPRTSQQTQSQIRRPDLRTGRSFAAKSRCRLADAERMRRCAPLPRRNWALITWWTSPAWTITATTRASRSSIILRLWPPLPTAAQDRRERGKVRVADRHRGVAHGGLARARDLRHDGHPLPRPSRSAPDSDVGRLSLFPVAEGFPAGRQADRCAGGRLHPGRAAGRRTVCDHRRAARTPSRASRACGSRDGCPGDQLHAWSGGRISRSARPSHGPAH